MTILMAGLYLMALMGKNLPVLFSSVLVTKKGLLQRCRSFRVKIFSFRYSSSQLSSSSAFRHWRLLSQRNFSGTQIFFPAHLLPSLAVHISFSPQPPPCTGFISLLPSMQTTLHPPSTGQVCLLRICASLFGCILSPPKRFGWRISEGRLSSQCSHGR